jgi:SAM-dependent MidA family methyltransferase
MHVRSFLLEHQIKKGINLGHTRTNSGTMEKELNPQSGSFLMKPLAQRLREDIQNHGTMPFAAFMQRSLYDPADGYYARANQQIGKRGDFFTSVSIGPLFGELLAFRFARWLEAEKIPGAQFQNVETGAHDGQLARDILEAVESKEPGLVSSVDYWIIEPSPARRAAQEIQLAHFRNVRWFTQFAELDSPVRGVIFSNELLDAMPVHPFAWNAVSRTWEEMGVTVIGEEFVWARLSQPTTQPPELPAALLNVLPDGYVIELSPNALDWWREAAHLLESGRLMTIDYGGTVEELLSPGRTAGTLRAYSRHAVGANALAHPGEQDITAHVNFTELQRVGIEAGLTTECFTNQSQFLTEISHALWTQTGSWPQQHIRQFQTLTHPEHLGRPFKVLVQSRRNKSGS